MTPGEKDAYNCGRVDGKNDVRPWSEDKSEWLGEEHDYYIKGHREASLKRHTQSCQELTYKGIFGEVILLAPKGWEFNDTDVMVWQWLLHAQTDLVTGISTKRETRYVEGKRDAHAQILSLTLGMAAHYWKDRSLKQVKITS